MYPVVFVVPGPWGQLPIYAYGVCLALGLLAAWYVGRARMKQAPDALSLSFVAAVVGAALAGAGGHALLALLGAAPTQSALSGRAVSGPLALLGGLGGLALIQKRGGPPAATVMEALAPALPLAYAADALGHYLHGSGFGRLLAADAPSWLAGLGTFPRWELPDGGLGAPAYVHHLLAHAASMPADAAASLPVYPVQLYDLVAAALVFVLVWRRPAALGPEGASLPAAAALLALVHLAFDGARYLEGGPPAMGMFVSQWLTLLVVVVGFAAWGRARRAGFFERA